MGTKYISGELKVSDSIFEGGVSLVNKYAKDSSVVHKTGDETIYGTKTIGGGITMNPATARIVANKNDNIKPERNQMWSSPVPKYLWHDILSFGMKGTPTVETSTDGDSWVATTDVYLTKVLFINKEASRIEIINDSTPNIRWTWNHNEFSYCEAAWLAVGVCHDANPATVETIVECSTDGTTWRTLHISSENTNQAPRWFLLDHTQWQGANWCRITMKRTSDSGTIRKISNIKLLTSRWGDQGKGSEYEYPYTWDHNLAIYPRTDSSQNLGHSGNKWKETWSKVGFFDTCNVDYLRPKKDSGNNDIGASDRYWSNAYINNIYENGVSLRDKYAQDSSVVHKSGDETITGNKTFNGTLISNVPIENNKYIKGGFIDLHPESKDVTIPFYNNVLAYLEQKGGSCTITGAKNIQNQDRIFNGTGNYTHLYFNDVSDVITINIKTHTYLNWWSTIGISFGTAYWCAKYIKVELGYADTIGGEPNNDAWVTVGEETNLEQGTYVVKNVKGPLIVGSSGDWNNIRITLTNFYAASDKQCRIAGIFAYTGTTGGLETTMLQRSGGEMYGHIYPYKDGGMSIGTSDKTLDTVFTANVKANYVRTNSVSTKNVYPQEEGYSGEIGSSTHKFNSTYSKNIYTNYLAPIDGNSTSGVGSSENKWLNIYGKNIFGDTIRENGVTLENKYSMEKYLALSRNSTVTQIMCCDFYTLTFNTTWAQYQFELFINDMEASKCLGKYVIRGKTRGETNIIDCEICKIYEYRQTGFSDRGCSIFAVQNENVLTFYIETYGAYMQPRIYINKLYGHSTTTYALAQGTWTAEIPEATFTEVNILDERYASKEYVDTNYIPKKSINNAYQAIVDNSGAAFTVTAGLSNNTSQTKFKIAPSGVATIDDKQIAIVDNIPTKSSWNYDDSYVKYSAAQTLTNTQKTQARSNIGAGTSSFSGNYNDLSNKPTAANGNIVVGNASSALTDSGISLTTLREIASGATNTYVAKNKEESFTLASSSITTQPAEGTKAIRVSEIKDTTGTIIELSKFKVGDVVLLTAVDEPDWFVATTGTGFITLAELETRKINLEPYETKANAITGLSVSGKVITYTKGNGATGTITTQDTTYNNATTSAAGLMSKDDKTKLNGITSGATKVEASTTNGKIKINGTETTVYTHPGSGTNPHGTTKSDVGLGNVGNFKAVSTVASQGLTSTEKSNARANIGAGTSNLTLGTTATTAAAGDHTHSVATTSANGLMSKEDKTKLDTISNNYVREYSTGKNGMPGTIINNGSSIYIDSGNDSINVIGEGDEHGVSISVGDNNFVNFYQDRTEMIDAPVKIKQIQAPTASNGTTYGLGTSGQVLKSNGTSVYWASDNNTTYSTFTRGSTDFSPAYTLTAKDAGFIHTWWRCSSNLYASCNFGNVIAVSATNLFPMQKYSPGTNTSNQTTAYQKSVSSGSGSYSNNSSNAFQIPQRGDMVIDQYGCIGVIESDPTTVVSTYSVRLVWKSIKDWSCLEKGTQITLADGTYKNIEDVRQGESIMGWDFEKNEPCEAIALFADAAQADEKTTYLVLDNGEILSMTDGHTLYSKNLERYIPINDLREGDILMGKDGEDVEVVSIHWNIHTFGIRQFYHVVSSNNTYFANNTLNAIHPVDKYNWLQNRSSEVVPDEILTIFEQDKGEFDCFDFTIKNKEFLALTSKHQSTLKKHRNKIGDLKNYLTNTDYVAIKMFEGLEVDETILDIRKEKRKEINALEKEIEKIEKEYNNLLVQYSVLGEDMLLSDNARRSKYFKVACKNDNEHLDLFKKYYPLKDEAYILKEIEEGKANRPITEVIEEEESE